MNKECQYSHKPQEEPTSEPHDEAMLQADLLEANLLEDGNEATASALAEKQRASEAASERRTPVFARAQAECDAAAQDKQDLLHATMNDITDTE